MARFWAGGLEVDTTARTITGRRQARGLTPTEADLLAYLYARRGQPVPREELLVQVWGYRPGVRSRTVDTTLSRLRGKLEHDATTPAFLRTRRGLGIELRGVTETRADEPWRVRVAYPQGPDLCGRDAPLHDLMAHVQHPGVQVLTGPGGVGKTALAQALLRAWDDGRSSPLFADLSACHTPAEVRAVIATVVGAPSSQQPAALREALQQRARPLVVADPVEHLPEESLATLRACCANVPLVLTSRHALPDIGHAHPVPPLDARAATTLLRRSLKSAGSAVPEARIEAAVAGCGGLPLALELLAPTLELLGPQVERWLLDVQDPARPERQRSLAAVFEAGFDSLQPGDRDTLMACAVFRSEFDIAGACAATGRPAPDVLTSLTTLRDRSWVRSEHDMLRIVRPGRAFALRQLADPARVRDRIDRWLVDQAESLTLGSRRVARAYRHDLLDALQRAGPDHRLALLQCVYISALSGGWVPEATARLHDLRWTGLDAEVLAVLTAVLARQLSGEPLPAAPELPPGSLHHALVHGVLLPIADKTAALAYLEQTAARTEPAIRHLRAAACSMAPGAPAALAELEELARLASTHRWSGLQHSVEGTLALSLAAVGNHSRALELLDALDQADTLDPALFLPRARIHVLFAASRLDELADVAADLRDAAHRAHLHVHAQGAWLTEALAEFAQGHRESVASLLADPEPTGDTTFVALLQAWVDGRALQDAEPTGSLARIVAAALAGDDPTSAAHSDIAEQLLATGLRSGRWG